LCRGRVRVAAQHGDIRVCIRDRCGGGITFVLLSIKGNIKRIDINIIVVVVVIDIIIIIRSSFGKSSSTSIRSIRSIRSIISSSGSSGNINSDISGISDRVMVSKILSKPFLPGRCHTSPINGSSANLGENAKIHTDFNSIHVKLSEVLLVAVEVQFLKRALDKTCNMHFVACIPSGVLRCDAALHRRRVFVLESFNRKRTVLCIFESLLERRIFLLIVI